MFCHFERSYPPREIQPPDWNLSLVLRCLSRPPFEPLKLASDKHLTWKMSFLLARVSAKRISELHGLSFGVRHSHGRSRVPPHSFLTGKPPFYLLVCQPKGLLSYTAFPSGFIIHTGEVVYLLVPS